MLVHHAMTLDLMPEAMKAWSQNLGHADLLTAFTSYGAVPTHLQGELVRSRCERRSAAGALPDTVVVLEALTASMKGTA